MRILKNADFIGEAASITEEPWRLCLASQEYECPGIDSYSGEEPVKGAKNHAHRNPLEAMRWLDSTPDASEAEKSLWQDCAEQLAVSAD